MFSYYYSSLEVLLSLEITERILNYIPKPEISLFLSMYTNEMHVGWNALNK